MNFKISDIIVGIVSYLGILLASLLLSSYLPLIVVGGDDNLRPIFIAIGIIFATLIICTRLIIRNLNE